MLLFVAASYNKLLFWLLLSRVITAQGGAAFFFFRMHFSGEQVSLMPASYFFLFFFWSPSSKRQSSAPLFFSEDKILRKRKGQRWTLFKSEHSMMKVRTDIMRTFPTLIYTCNPIGAVHVDVGTLFDSIAYQSTQLTSYIYNWCSFACTSSAVLSKYRFACCFHQLNQ